MGYMPSKPDPNLWIKDVGTHYEYIATYVDDILIWSKDPMQIIDTLKCVYILKGVGIPEYYFGGNVEVLDEHWTKQGINMAFSSTTYVKNIIPKFETLFGQQIKT